MNKRHIAITGPTSGLGRATSLALARDGTRLTLLCRNAEKGARLQQEIIEAGGEPPR
ncbi:MAG: SDR family NAD(P)-dependent oxidoreductase [Halioglobus sp.]|nr:SDR family NAD(P)-dependent oxidoreductase [Halioglobus sp.]